MGRADWPAATTLRRVIGALGVAGLLAPVASEVRFKRPLRPLTDRWTSVPVAPRGTTLLGISFRPLQCEALGLEPAATLRTLLDHPFAMIRLGAYWDRMEPDRGRFDPETLDWQVDAAEAAGKQIIVAVGAVKTFGYPECFVPAHHLDEPLREGTLIEPRTHPGLLDAATAFVTRVVDRYRDRRAIVAWQVEHEPVDPLGIEHSWRLSSAFLRKELEAVRAADPTRPIMLNGYLPTSLPVRIDQWWRTHDQGDSLSVAMEMADVVGIDFYPRHGLISVAGRTLYLDGANRPWEQARRRELFDWAAPTGAQAGAPTGGQAGRKTGPKAGRKVMISEGQAEPWEAVTVPPSPEHRVMYSCPPERVIENYNRCLSWSKAATNPWAYLFWGADYWVLRQRQGDPSYLGAFGRILAES
jgi:hypothetical protein